MDTTFDALMKDFLAKLGVEPEAAEDGEQVFGIDIDGLEVIFEPGGDGESVLVFAVVGTLPAERGGDVLKTLLAANCFFRGTGRATLAVSESDEVLLQQVIDSAFGGDDADRFAEEAERFVAIAEYWRRQLAGTGVRPSEPPAAAGDAIRA